jgi:tRNA pseudouridine32 synthase / 23S rRNA pseudouridine746 synthase
VRRAGTDGRRDQENLRALIEIVHDNDDLIVVSKPEGIATVPENDPSLPSVRRILEDQRGERLWPVHRLDKEVSGVLVFARNADAHRELSTLFEARDVEKTYLALVDGIVSGDREIDAPIREFGSGRMGVSPDGKPSVTSVAVRDRGDDCSLVEALARTGRRHQIRVHLFSVGHPILGDRRYGDVPASRLMLHAWKVVVRGNTFEAPPSETFLNELGSRGVVGPDGFEPSTNRL